jgi:hypothetical protein
LWLKVFPGVAEFTNQKSQNSRSGTKRGVLSAEISAISVISVISGRVFSLTSHSRCAALLVHDLLLKKCDAGHLRKLARIGITNNEARMWQKSRTGTCWPGRNKEGQKLNPFGFGPI